MFLEYFTNALRATMLIASFQSSGEMIEVEKALDYFDAQIVNIENYYGIQINQDKKEEIKSKIYSLSYNYEVDFTKVQKIIIEFEQEVNYGVKGEVIASPDILKPFREIFHFVANQQYDSFSCGYWTLVAAKAINDSLKAYDSEKLLDFETINRQAKRIIDDLFYRAPAKLLGAEHINHYAVKDQACKLNKRPFKNLIKICKIESLEDYEAQNFLHVCDNKLHVVRLIGLDAEPCCMVNNEAMLFDKDEAFKIFFDRINELGIAKMEASVKDSLCSICGPVEILDEVSIELGKNSITEINWDSLARLIEDLEEADQQQIISLIIGYADSLIKDEEFKTIISSYSKKGLMSDIPIEYQNQSLLTLFNLFWAANNISNQTNIYCSQNEGPISSLAYFKALLEHFKKLVNNGQTGALYFACKVSVVKHWILIAVVNLPGKTPFVGVLDSMNSPIVFPLICDDQNLEAIYESIKELKRTGNEYIEKILYILFFYDLFINGNENRINIPLAQELHKLSEKEKRNNDQSNIIRACNGFLSGNGHSSNLSEEQQIKIATARSMEGIKRKKGKKRGSKESENDKPKEYIDNCPGKKGKEKESPAGHSSPNGLRRNGYHDHSDDDTGNGCEKIYDHGSGS